MRPSFTRRSHLGPVCRGQFERSYLFYDWPSTLSSNAPAFRGQSRLSGFCCANRLCVRSPCHHNSRMRTFEQNKFGGITGRSPGERPHYGIAGGSPACRGKSQQTGPDVNAGTGWPRKNATTLIVNFINIVDETELFLFYLVEHSLSNKMTVWHHDH